MKKGQKKRRSVILRRVLALLLAIVLIHSQIMPAVFAADTNYSQESNTEEKTVVDGAETVLPMSEDAISEPSEPIQSEEQQTEDKVSEDTTVESSEPIQSGEQQTEDAADAEQSPEVETTGEAAEETVNIADAVVPVTVNYYLPKSQNLQVDAPESYTEGEAQEEAKSAVIEQALGDETTQKLIEQQKEKGIESNTQELTASAVSEEEYDSYTQMAVTGEGLQAPEVSLSDDVQLEEDADAENTNPLIGWQVAKTAGIMLSYPDGTEIKMGDVIPADKISEVQMTAADDGISLLSTQANMSIASLIALTQDMTVVQRVGDAGTNGKWSVLVQGGTNQTPSAGTVRHAYGTLESALTAINTDTTSNSFKITFLDNYTASSADLSAMGSKYGTSGVLGKRTTNKPTIVFTGATNYSTGTSYSSWTTFTSQKQKIYFDGFNAYFTHVNLDWSGSTVYGNQNDTTFDDVKFVGGAVIAIYGGRYYSNSTNVSYNLKFKDVEMTKDAPVKQIFGGGQDNSTGTINLTMTNCTIYGNVYASSGPIGTSTTYIHTGNVYATLQDTAIRKFNTTVVDPMLKPDEIHTVGGSFWGLYGTVSGDLYLRASGSYSADCGTWFTAKEGCTAGSISYIFNDIKESLRFVGAYEHAGYDQATTSKGYIEVNNTQVANVFGWGYLRLNNSATCDGVVNNFGHMQYDSSFYHYWTEQKKQDAKGGDRYVPKDYKPDLPTCIGYVATKSSTICSGGDCYEAWNRQRFGRIVLEDNYNTFQIYNAMGGNSTNVVDVYYLDRISASYKATIELMAIKANATASDAFSMIRTRGNYNFPTSVSAIGTLKTHANVSCTMAQDPTNRLIKLYATANAENIIYLYSGRSNTGNAIYSANSFKVVLDYLRSQTGTYYTLWFTKGYSLVQEDVTAFNDAREFTNKNVTIIADAALSGSHEQGSPNTGVNLWGTVYPQFKSLTWKNAKFRSDFLLTHKYPYVMHGNGHNLTFENCTFAGDVTINAGGNSTQGTSGSTLTLKNCVNVNKIYASKQQDGLGNTTINVESCTGHTGSIIIDPAYYGTVNNLEINVTDCIAKIEPSYISPVKVEGDYKLTATNTQLMFTNPTVSSGHTAKVYLNKDSSNHEVVLLGDCKGAFNAPDRSSRLYVIAKVRPKDATSVNLDYFDQIEIDGGELHLGDASNSVTGGFGNGGKRPDISLKNSGKLMLDYLPSERIPRTIDSLTTDGTNTEVSVTYDYKGETSPSGRPLIIKNTLRVPTNRELRISTTFAPTHKGAVEYPLIQFDYSNDAKLEQYNWIADKQYYLAIGSRNSNQIVLRADTYAPLVYQAKTTNMSLNSNGSQSGQLEIYLRDLYRDGIDTSGISINDASDGAYPTGFQVYLSTQDVQLKDGVYGYTYNSSTDLQLKPANVYSYSWMRNGAFRDINGTPRTATTESPVLNLKLESRTYQTNTNYYIYARDIAGNWSKFLLDTKGPTSTYTNITSTKVSDGTYSYKFTELKFADPIQTATYGTSDIADVSYKANATQYSYNDKKLDATVRYNKTGKNPWESGVSYSTASLNTSTGTCTLSNVSVSVTEKLYVFVKDGYGNISRFTYVPIVFDAQSGGATSTGKFGDGSTTSSTLGLVGSTLKSAQEPSSPLLGNQRFRYWYNSKNSGKYQVSLTSETVSDETTYYYPQWTYPTLTISNQVTGSVADKNKKFTYTIYAQPGPGFRYNGQEFPYTGGTIAGISGVTAPANGTKTGDYNGEFTIELSHGQSVTIQLPGYYDYVSVSQNKESPYWTVYTTEENKQYNQNYTGEISVNATNRSLAFVNSNDSSQPVIYQQKMEGEWTKDQGDNYGRKLTVYIRDLYGDGIDTQGSSFSTSERAEFPGCTYAQVYLSTYDAPKADRGFKFRYNASESERLESLCSCRKLTSGSVRDIEGKTVTATSEKPVWAFKMLNTYKFDQNKNYFIYVRDLTGKWTKYLLDTKGPRIENTGIITKSKDNDNDTEFKISKIQVKDEMIDVANGTSDLTNESQENFTYVANATKYKGTQVSLVRNNKTGKFSDTYKTPTKATDGTYTAVESMNNGEMLYVYAQDYYGNTTAQQYVLVGFDASGNAQYKKAIFKDKTRLKRELVAKGQKLLPSQIPSDPGFYNDTTSQKFTQWSDSTDANKKKVDLKTAQMTKSVILNADYDKPSVIIKQMIKGDGIWNNQEFTYKVKTSYPKGKVIPCKGSYVSPAVNAPNITSLTVDENQEITFKLKAGQSLELIPGDNQYTIKSIIQDSNGTNCEIQKDAKVISSVANVAVDEISTNFVFTNTKNIVVTGVDGGNTDNSLLLVGLMGVLLITGVSVLRVRGRRRS